jgi:hypothetical protein
LCLQADITGLDDKVLVAIGALKDRKDDLKVLEDVRTAQSQRLIWQDKCSACSIHAQYCHV